MDEVTLHHGDCLDVLRTLPDASVDAVVTDPPYDLTNRTPDVKGCVSCGRTLGGADGNPEVCPRCGGELTRQRSAQGKGFMGKAWDGTGIAFRPAVWVECLRVLKPGGHLLAFGGTRTWHRLACAVEDAGFEVRDSIAWLYGSGFPKSLDVSKAIDKARDDKPEVLAVAEWLREQIAASGVARKAIGEHFGLDPRGVDLWAPNPNDNSAKQRVRTPTWEQWRALSDLLSLPDDMDAEVWRLNGRKGTPGEAWDQREVIGQDQKAELRDHVFFGDAEKAKVNGRAIGYGGWDITAPATDDARTWQGWGTALKPAFEPVVVARKPLVGTVAGNVLAYGTGALNVDGCRIEGAPSGLKPYTRSTTPEVYALGMAKEGREVTFTDHPAGRWPANVVLDGEMAEVLDEQSGESASREHPSVVAGGRLGNGVTHGELTSDSPRIGGHTDQGGASRFFYVAREDNEPCTETQTTDALMSDATSAEPEPKLTTPRTQPPGGVTTTPLDTLGSRFQYVAKADASERVRVNSTAHPTVKPLALMRWLVRLVCPPGGVVLDPFAGSGTTAEACLLEGSRCIAIEREADYIPLIRLRIARRQDPVAAVQLAGIDGGLFDLIEDDA